MTTFTQINKLAIQCQDIVVEYNKDAVKYGLDKVEMKSTEYYELLITAMLSAGATINDIKVNHVQIALGKFPEDDKEVNNNVKTFELNNGSSLTFTLNNGETLTVEKVSFDNYTIYKDEKVIKEWLSKKELKEALSKLNINNIL